MAASTSCGVSRKRRSEYEPELVTTAASILLSGVEGADDFREGSKFLAPRLGLATQSTCYKMIPLIAGGSTLDQRDSAGTFQNIGATSLFLSASLSSSGQKS